MNGEASGFQRILRRLSRVSSTGRFLPVVDGLRFVAILSVILYHLQPTFSIRTGQSALPNVLLHLVDRGDFGVRLFFTISGFILALPFAEAALAGAPRPQLSRYFLRRLTRLEPPYLLCLAAMFVMILLLGKGTAGELWPHLLASATYLHNLVYGQVSAVNGVAWSLEVEVQFYVLAPLLAGLFTIRSARLRRTIFAVAIVALSAANTAYRLSDQTDEHLRYFLSLPFHLPYFLAGYLLADFHVSTPHEEPPKTLGWDVVGLAGWGALAAALLATSSAFNAALAPLVFVAYAGTYRGKLLSRLFSVPLVTTVGGMCYTIYLYHYQILSTVGRLTFRLARPGWPFVVNYFLQVLVIVPIIVLIGAVLFALFERPFMKRDWWRRTRPAAAVEPAPSP